MNNDDSRPASAGPVWAAGNAPPPSPNPLGLTLTSPSSGYPGALASAETVEAFERKRQEREIRRRMREEEEARSPPVPSKSISILDIVSDSFNAGREEGRREMRLAQELMARRAVATARAERSDLRASVGNCS
jgi:hypothetical protein